MKQFNERLIGATGSVSGAASILGSWQVCHNICLALIAALGVMGVTLTGMPLLFFTKIAVPLWLFAVALLGVVVYLYFTRSCVSRNLLLINTGLITAGTPFWQSYQPVFWIVGGALVLLGIVFWTRGRVKKRCEHET